MRAPLRLPSSVRQVYGLSIAHSTFNVYAPMLYGCCSVECVCVCVVGIGAALQPAPKLLPPPFSPLFILEQMMNRGSVGAPSAVPLGPSSSCTLQCPQCSHLISLLATLPQLPVTGAGADRHVSHHDDLPRLRSKSVVNPTTRSMSLPSSAQHVRLPGGHTVRVVGSTHQAVLRARASLCGSPLQSPSLRSTNSSTASKDGGDDDQGATYTGGVTGEGDIRSSSVDLTAFFRVDTAHPMMPGTWAAAGRGGTPSEPSSPVTVVAHGASRQPPSVKRKSIAPDRRSHSGSLNPIIDALLEVHQVPSGNPLGWPSMSEMSVSEPLDHQEEPEQDTPAARITLSESNGLDVLSSSVQKTADDGAAGSAVGRLPKRALPQRSAASPAPSLDVLTDSQRMGMSLRRSGNGGVMIRSGRRATFVTSPTDDAKKEDTPKRDRKRTAIVIATDDSSQSQSSGEATITTNVGMITRCVSAIKSARASLARKPALDDAATALQLLDIGFFLFSVFLCCFATFLLYAPSRPWLINTTTGTMVVVAQLFTMGWMFLRFFVRNRDSTASYVVNDTVGDAARKYVASVAFWLDLIVAFPVEWMVVPLLSERDMSWWALQPTASALRKNITTSSPLSRVQKTAKTAWEVIAAVFAFFMLRHFLRYWRIASLIRSSNPIISERPLFRFLTALSIALAVLCACAVAFQTWEGPTLAPILVAEGECLGRAAPAGYSTTPTPLDVDEASVTTPGLFASFDALYWSMTTALTVGYGDITPTTPGGRAVAMITMIVGTALLSTMTAIATSYFANKDPVQQELEERMRKMTSMLEYFEVPWELQRDVIASFPAVMEAHSRAAFLDLINFLPEICRNRVEGYSRLRLLRQIPHFEGIEREHAFMLAKCLTQRFVAAQDMVVVQGELGNEMYFVMQGILDILVQLSTHEGEHVVVATLRGGTFFGERGLLEDTPRAASVMAITLTELLVLTRADFHDIVRSVPAILELFKRNVFKVKEKAAEKVANDVFEMMAMQPPPSSSQDGCGNGNVGAAPGEEGMDGPSSGAAEAEGVNPKVHPPMEAFRPSVVGVESANAK